MNWEAIGALGDIIGAVAVVVSLVYLGRQIKQGTDLARTDFHSRSVDTLARFQNWKSASVENARIFRTGMLDFYSLSTDERIILDGVLLDLVLAFKDVLEAYERGFMDVDTYQAWFGFIGTNIGMPGARTWWEHARPIYVPKVRSTVDQAINSAAPYQQLMSVLFEDKPSITTECDG